MHRTLKAEATKPAAANVLTVAGRVVCAEAHPRTRQRIDACRLSTVAVVAGELAKAEGGLTCCSLLVAAHAQRLVPILPAVASNILN
jgi:dimethylargininase